MELEDDLLNDGGSNNAGGDVLGPAAACDTNVHGFLNVWFGRVFYIR